MKRYHYNVIVLLFVTNFIFSQHANTADRDSAIDPLIIVNLTPISIPVVFDSAIKGMITITLVLSIIDPTLENTVSRVLPKLKDKFFKYMYSYGTSSSARKVLPLDTIMLHFQRLTDEEFGPGKVKILVQSVQQSRKN